MFIHTIIELVGTEKGRIIIINKQKLKNWGMRLCISPIWLKKEEEERKKKKGKKKGDKESAIENEIKPPEGITAFFASNINQLTYKHPDIDNGIFTYYLLKGLRGEADNGDKSVTVAELHDFIMKNVQDTTSKLYSSMPQVPVLFTPDPNRVLYKLP